jgi:hypothetical protein
MGAGPPEDAAMLAERLGGLPLALHHAGSQLSGEFARASRIRLVTTISPACDERM